jgi:hypothetical protein
LRRFPPKLERGAGVVERPKEVDGELGREYDGELGREYDGELGREYDGELGREYDGELRLPPKLRPPPPPPRLPPKLPFASERVGKRTNEQIANIAKTHPKPDECIVFMKILLLLLLNHLDF